MTKKNMYLIGKQRCLNIKTTYMKSHKKVL